MGFGGRASARRRAGSGVGGFAISALAALTLAASAAADPPAPGGFGDDDFGGFRNVLPAGQNGFITTDQFLDFLSNGTRPPHSQDQLGLYTGLLHEAPGLSEAEVDSFFKDATFGVPAADAGAIEYTPDCAVTSAPSPSSAHCDDVTLVRDSAYGVPHIYGADRAALMFGIGYASAQDRLFFMDVQRHTGRAQLSSFLGGANRGTDRSIWRTQPYTEQELVDQYEALDDLYGADGAQIQADGENYVDGVNQYIAEAYDDDAKMPHEYKQIFFDDPEPIDPWEVADVVATASLFGGVFGKGGGGEVGSALVLEEAKQRFPDPGDGEAVWGDFRSAEDGETENTVKQGSFPYGETPDTPQGVALPDAGSVITEPTVVTPPAPRMKRGEGGEGVMEPLLEIEGMSNALLVSADEAAGEHPIAVMGPQVSHYSPAVMMEQDIHAPGGAEGPAIDARGMAFPGANIYVQIGHGQDYAWSATSASNDVIDTFALELCDPASPGDPGDIDDTGYRYDGTCEPFEVLDRENEWEPNIADPTPAGSETLRSLRTKLGIVTHRAMVGGEPVVYTSLRATYLHELDSALGFAKFNQPGSVASPEDFQQAANEITYTFNWFYADDEHIAYMNSGANPVRAANIDPNLPIAGEPANTWQSFDPDTLTFDMAPFAEHPQVIDQDYIVNWNNKQAPDYRAADNNWGYQSVHRVEMLSKRIEEGIAGAETMTRAELVDAMEDAATVDLRGQEVLRWALKVMRSKPIAKKKVRKAVKKLAKWRRADAHRIDRNADGTYERSKAIQLMDAWWPLWVERQFKPTLGDDLWNRVVSMIGLHNAPGASGSSYGSGWYGYVEKDLRDVLGKGVADPFSRQYCGEGKLGQCRRALLGALRAALKVDYDTLYPSECAEGDPQWCRDAIRFTTVGVVGQPRIHHQNRPTLQQVVEVQGHRP